jgi:hypothetical protein
MSSNPAYRFEHRLEHYGNGDLDTWLVLATKRSDRDPMAKCYSRDDAALIVVALNAATDKAA